MQFLISLILKKPKTFLACFFGFYLVFLSGLQNLKPNYYMRYWLKPSDPLIKTLDYYERHFGNDETIVVSVTDKNSLLNSKGLNVVESLREEIENLKNIRFAHALTDFEIPVYSTQKQSVEMQKIVSDNQNFNLNEFNQKIEGNPIAKDFFISRDAKTALIFGVLKRAVVWDGVIVEDVNYRELVQQMNLLKDKFESENISIQISGTAVLQNDFHEISESDAIKVLPIIFLLMGLILFYLFRSWRAVVFPLTVLSFTNAMTYAFGGFMGFQIENLFSVVPLIVMTICLADTIHFYTSYVKFIESGKDKINSIKESVLENWFPTLLTSITTALGFFSLSFSELVPVKNLGILSGFGVMLAWLLSMTVLPVLLSFGKGIGFSKNHKLESLDFSSLAVQINKYRKQITISFCILAITCFTVGMNNHINTDPLKFFKKDWPARKAADFIIDRVGAVTGPELLIHSGFKQGVLEPDFLRKIEKLSDWLNEQDFIHKTISIVDIAKRIYQVDNQNDSKYFRIPDTELEIRGLILEYQDKLSSTMNVSSRVTSDFEAIRLSLLWPITDTKTSLEKIDRIKSKAKEIDVDIEFTGKSTLYLKMNDYVVRTFFRSMAIAFALITLLMIYVFRSIKLGILSMLPNIVPISFILALMALFDIRFDMGTAIVASVCLGVAIDDTIHFLFHYRRYRLDGQSREEAISKVLSQTGRALILTTFILSSCFALFMMGDFIPNVNFGLLCSLTLAFALITDLVLLPAILLMFDNSKKAQ